MERLEAEPGMTWGFLYAHWSSQPYQGWGLVPKSRIPEGGVQAAFLPSECVLPALLTMKCLLQWRSMLEQEDLSSTWYRPVCVLVLCLYTSQSSGPS